MWSQSSSLFSTLFKFDVCFNEAGLHSIILLQLFLCLHSYYSEKIYHSIETVALYIHNFLKSRDFSIYEIGILFQISGVHGRLLWTQSWTFSNLEYGILLPIKYLSLLHPVSSIMKVTRIFISWHYPRHLFPIVHEVQNWQDVKTDLWYISNIIIIVEFDDKSVSSPPLLLLLWQYICSLSSV